MDAKSSQAGEAYMVLRALRATLLVNYWATQPLEPYCVPMPLQSASDFSKMPEGLSHPPHPQARTRAPSRRWTCPTSG